MGSEALEYIETVLTCKGNYYAPDFCRQLAEFKSKLQRLLWSSKGTTVYHLSVYMHYAHFM